MQRERIAYSYTYTREMGHKQCELSNHLGNRASPDASAMRCFRDSHPVSYETGVLVAVADVKTIVHDGGVITGYAAQVISATDYSPFGVALEGRMYASGTYRFGFQAQEQDKELWEGAVTYKYRVEDPRLGRFFSVDPLNSKYPYYSVYQFSGNRLIDMKELEGLEPVTFEENSYDVLVVVIQGYEGTEPPLQKTQVKNNPARSNDHKDLNILNDIEKNPTFSSLVLQFSSSDSERTKDDVKATIQNFHKTNPNGKIMIVGHSRGADNAVELITETPEVPIALLITIDICDGGDYDDDDIPANVDQAINFYNNLGWAEPGGETIERASGNNSTDIVNIPLPEPHREIDNAVSEDCILLITEKANGENWQKK